ncbi:MAG: hypothetical protein OZSIB_0075 [Candidatus Ozemobacter sibiricus]|jgi:hypothetical protein|uniref:Uncharacterized protein n=1 Tax=Candidatus Ozemobacter sibiricus TaxID=2268124 RepID=A0A367ZMS9_9BACT|nr:MAG: hypothetical protein OZSIB_0075 [Candidatus Ozemobacter sibiricus]
MPIFQPLSRLALAVVLIAGLRWPPAARAEELIARLPASGSVVISIDAARLLANPAWKNLIDDLTGSASQALAPIMAEFDATCKTLEVNPRQDLRDLAFLLPFPRPGGQMEEGLLLLRGTFQKEAMVAALEKDESFKIDGKIDTFEGLTAIRAVGKPDFTVFLASDLLAVGNESWLREAIAVQNGKGPALSTSPGFSDLVKRVPAGTPVWIGAVLTPESQQQIAQAASDTPYAAFSRMVDLLLTIDVTTAIEARLQVRAETPEAAGVIGSTIEGTIAQARLNATGAPAEWVKLLNGFTFKSEGAMAIVNLSYPLADVKVLVQRFQETTSPGGPAPASDDDRLDPGLPPGESEPEGPPDSGATDDPPQETNEPGS